MLHHHQADRCLVERVLPGQQLKQHHAHRIDICLWADCRLVDLLRGEIGQRAFDRPGNTGGGVARELFGDPEVRQVSVAVFVDQDIIWLEVTVDHADFMRRLERVGHLVHDVRSLGQRQRLLAAQQVREAAPANIAHNEKGPFFLVAPKVDQRDDKRVFQLGDELGLFFKVTDKLWLAGILRQNDLNRDLTVYALLNGAVNSTIAPSTDTFFEQVPTDDAIFEVVTHKLVSNDEPLSLWRKSAKTAIDDPPVEASI